MFPKWFKEYLSFHRSERNGIILLSVILMLLIGYNVYQRLFWESDFEQVKLEYGQRIVEFTERQELQEAEVVEDRQPWLPEKIAYFQFDPNMLDSAGWVRLGFSPKQSASIINYRNAGAVFRKPEDVKKLFVVDDQKYEELKSFILIEHIPESNTRKFKDHEKPAKPRFGSITIELNTADTTQLMKLHGIGPSFSKRIVKYRELLGGYLSKEQLLEVYGMDSARYRSIADRLEVDTTVRTRININMAEIKDLMRHPYISRNQARAIVNYRKQHGIYTGLEDLRNIHLIHQEEYIRMIPYLRTQ